MPTAALATLTTGGQWCRGSVPGEQMLTHAAAVSGDGGQYCGAGSDVESCARFLDMQCFQPLSGGQGWLADARRC